MKKKVCEMISAVKAFTAGAAATILWERTHHLPGGGSFPTVSVLQHFGSKTGWFAHKVLPSLSMVLSYWQVQLSISFTFILGHYYS